MRKEPYTADSRNAFTKASTDANSTGSATPAYFPPQQYTRLLSGLIHKLNNVVTVLSGHTGLLSLQPNLSPSVREPVEQMMEATQRLSRYLDEAVRLSRSPQLKVGPVDIVSLLGAVAESAADLRLNLNGLPSTIIVYGDAQQLRSAFEQTLQNAGEAHASNVTCSAKELSESWQITFRDDGKGISRDVINRIFEPFFTTKKGDNIGLGLFRIQGYLALTGGGLEVTSDGKTYTEVRFFLPKAAQRAAS